MPLFKKKTFTPMTEKAITKEIERSAFETESKKLKEQARVEGREKAIVTGVEKAQRQQRFKQAIREAPKRIATGSARLAGRAAKSLFEFGKRQAKKQQFTRQAPNQRAVRRYAPPQRQRNPMDLFGSYTPPKEMAQGFGGVYADPLGLQSRKKSKSKKSKQAMSLFDY